MTAASPNSPHLSPMLARAAEELRRIENLLLTAGDLDPWVLTDFRDAVNRVRTTAWGVQQYAQSKNTDTDPHAVLSVLAAERVRAAYVMCAQILADLNNDNIDLQKGPLLRLQEVAKELAARLQKLSQD